MSEFAELQADLGGIWSLNRPSSTTDHVLIAMPSFSVAESLLSHYASRLPSMEHRYLVVSLMLARVPRCELVFIASSAPTPEMVDYYFSLMPDEVRADARSRLTIVEVPDSSPRSVAAKLLDRPDILGTLRTHIGDRPAYIEPWNVTSAEVAVALALQAPIYGTAPELWPLGFKSAGRRLFAEAGVPTACGCEDVHTVDEVCAAVSRIRSLRPATAGVVLKHDNSGAGDGNAVIRLDDTAAVGLEERARSGFAALPDWYRQDLLAGGVAEELVTGKELTSPSAQFDISPYGEVVVLATHEQVLGGDNGQVYTGCTFPARQVYAREIGEYALAVGRQLARHGCCGRVSVDFVAGADDAGSWSLFALEMNLRKGGTTHPYAVLRNLVPGRYDVEAGQWVAADGTTRCYRSSDNVVDPVWQGLPPGTVIKTLAEAGLEFDSATGTGVVLHMLAGLAVDGRFGVTAIGLTPEHASELYEAVRRVLPI